MNPDKRKTFLAFLFGGLGMFVLLYLFNGFPQKNPSSETRNTTAIPEVVKPAAQNSSADISQITKAEVVIEFVKDNHQLPDFYLTKNKAKKLGWNPSQGNLCDVLPGRAIGGDHFSNREKQLPEGEQYFEADVNYSCGNRNSDRIIFTKNGDVYLTTDHYKSFQKQ